MRGKAQGRKGKSLPSVHTSVEADSEGGTEANVLLNVEAGGWVTVQDVRPMVWNWTVQKLRNPVLPAAEPVIDHTDYPATQLGSSPALTQRVLRTGVHKTSSYRWTSENRVMSYALYIVSNNGI